MSLLTFILSWLMLCLQVLCYLLNSGTTVIDNATVFIDPHSPHELCVACNFTEEMEERQCFALIEETYLGMKHALVITNFDGASFGVNCTKELPQGQYTVAIFDEIAMTTPVFMFGDLIIENNSIISSSTTPETNKAVMSTKPSVLSSDETGMKNCIYVDSCMAKKNILYLVCPVYISSQKGHSVPSLSPCYTISQ